MATQILSMYSKYKWERQNLRKKIDKNREIGIHFRKKENKTWKWKLQKRRRSKRRNLSKATIDNAISYITDNFLESTISHSNQWKIVNYQVQTVRTTAAETKYPCALCNKSYPKRDLQIINCKECKAYTKRNFEKYRICHACVQSADLCTSKGRKSAFCKMKNTPKRCSGNHSRHNRKSSLDIKRRPDKPSQWEFASNVYAFTVDEKVAANEELRNFINLQGKHYVAYCKNCHSNPRHPLTTCQFPGCSNKDKTKICVSHQCRICMKYQETIGYAEERELRMCDICNEAYCVIVTSDPYDQFFDSNCGSVESSKCNKCYLENEVNSLKTAIYENTPLYDDVALILYEYATGCMFKCGNYTNCEQMLCWESMLDVERELDPMRIRRDGTVYRYQVSDPRAIQAYAKYLTNIQGRYWRLICNECESGKKLMRCQHYMCYPYSRRHVRCGTRDAGIISLKSGKPRHFCLGHREHDGFIVQSPQCDECGVSRTTINWFNTGLRECKICNKRLCKHCNQSGTHSCRAVKKRTLKIRNKCEDSSDGIQFNEKLADCDFIKYRNDRNWNKYDIRGCENYAKKSSRKRKKNKKKKQSYWKRQRDKKGNVKCYKRSKQSKLLSIMLKNDM